MVKLLKICRADQGDLTEARRVARAVHEEGIFSEIPFSDRKFEDFFKNSLEEPQNYLGLKVTMDDRILGFTYCFLGGYFMGEGARVVTVNTICVDPKVREAILGGKVAVKLVQGIKKWAKAVDAHIVLFHVTSGKDIAKADRFFRKMGLTTVGGNYGIRLK